MLSLWVFSSVAAAGGAKEVVGRREWKQPLSPENPEDLEVFRAMLGRQGWCQSPAENRLFAAHPQLPPPASTARGCRTRPLHKSLWPLSWGHPRASFLLPPPLRA